MLTVGKDKIGSVNYKPLRATNAIAPKETAPVGLTQSLSQPSASTLKAYYANPVKLSFGRAQEEHESWGAIHNPETGETSFKLFTFADNQSVKVIVAPDTKEPLRLKLAKNQSPRGQNEALPEGTKSFELKRSDNGHPEDPGVYTLKVGKDSKIKPGMQYCFEITKKDGTIDECPDPYSMTQPGVSTWSKITDKPYEHNNDLAWQKNPARLVRNSRVHQVIDGTPITFTPFSKANIYETHVGTLTKEGTFSAAITPGKDGKTPIQKIKEKTGCNAIEIMPVETVHTWVDKDGKTVKGYNWGYDGVNKFAVREDYGGRDKMKEFIKHCHDNGLSVIVDLVPNHIGVDGNYLSKTGPYGGVTKDEKTGWGDSFHLENGSNRYIRDYVANMNLYWLRLGADGTRHDMVSQMGSLSQLKQVSAEANHHYPDAFLIAEDGGENPAVSNGLHEGEYTVSGKMRQVNDGLNALGKLVQKLNGNVGPDIKKSFAEILTGLQSVTDITNGEVNGVHDEKIEKIMQGKGDLQNLGFDSKWGFKFNHNLSGTLIGRWEPGIGDVYEGDMKNLFNTIRHSATSGTVKYEMSHDEIGNHEGTRLVSKYVTDKLFWKDGKLQIGEKIESKGAKLGRLYQTAQQVSNGLAVAHATMDENGNTPINGKPVKMWGQDGKLTQEFQTEFMKHMKQNVLFLKEEGQDKKYYDKDLNVNLNHPDFNKGNFERIFNEGTKLHLVGNGVAYAVPGPKMIFQGNENMDLTPFRFARHFEMDPADMGVQDEKGYQTKEKAFEESKLSALEGKYSHSYQAKMDGAERFMKKLSEINAENPALSEGFVVDHIDGSRINNDAKILAFHTIKDSNEIFSIANFGGKDFGEKTPDKKYGMNFPQGKWQMIVCSNDTQYGGDGKNMNNPVISSDGKQSTPVEIPSRSFMMFKKAG